MNQARLAILVVQRPLLLIVVLLVPPAFAVGVREYRDYQRYPRRFAEAVPGALYRGGFPTADNIRCLHEDKSIRAVISLTDPKNTPGEKAMLAAVNDLGMSFFRINMPGDGRGDFTSLDMAADAMANKQNWPLFFHCVAGKQRSNAALFAYRFKYCGWTVDQALAELENQYGLDPVDEVKLCDHLRHYAAWVAAHRPLPPMPRSTTMPAAGHGDKSALWN